MYTYNYGADGIVMSNRDGAAEYYIKNIHGDVVGMTDAEGNLTDNYYYDAFGNEKNVTNDNNPFRYAGEYFDEESGLIYLRNRYYNSSTGRFITEDPAQAGVNWYSYCGGNPVNFIDPWGLESYIIYLPEFEREAYADKQDLVDMGVREDEIIMVQVDSAAQFKKGWNNMGYILDEDGNRTTDEDGNYLTYSSIDYVIINTHGDPLSIGTKELRNGGWNFGLDDIKKLDNKDITGNLLLLGCNTGHLDAEINPARSFAKKVNGALVIASDGSVSARDPNGFYQSHYDEEFDRWVELNEAPSRNKAEGWVVYRQNRAGYVTARPTGSTSAKLLIWGAMQLTY